MTTGKRNRRAFRIFCGLAILLGAAVFTGCGKKDAEGSGDSEKSDAKESREIDEKNWDGTVNISRGVKLEMVKVKVEPQPVKAQEAATDVRPPDWKPSMPDLTEDFYIGKTEVTQAQWMAVMKGKKTIFNGDDLPAHLLKWSEAMEFCEKLNEQGKAPKGWKFTLPTETQWEYAARGGLRSKGYEYSGSDDIGEVAWYRGNSEEKMHPVGKKKANELGLYDMSGNASEWCLDDWQERISSLKAEFTREKEPDDVSKEYAVRGGCWDSGEKTCLSTNRDYDCFSNERVGFRLALVPVSE